MSYDAPHLPPPDFADGLRNAKDAKIPPAPLIRQVDLGSGRPVEAETAAIAARMGLNQGASMTERGEHHGVVRAAISARVRRWGKRMGLDLPLPRECKQRTANYALYNQRREKTRGFDE